MQLLSSALCLIAACSAGSAPAELSQPAATLSPRRDACTRDDECALYNSVNETAGRPGGQAGCCQGSTLPSRAASRDWVRELDRYCASLPPGPCPGGNESPPRARCEAGHCVVGH
jgi:hypothetical protein